MDALALLSENEDDDEIDDEDFCVQFGVVLHTTVGFEEEPDAENSEPEAGPSQGHLPVFCLCPSGCLVRQSWILEACSATRAQRGDAWGQSCEGVGFL